jgi:glycosyltransferase involved in cell wall biosynthesis
MKLSIIIPVYNEINSLPVILKKIFDDTPKIKKKIIIVDDFSNDGTREWLMNKKKKNNINIIFKKKNGGKGSAVMEGIKYTKLNDIILIQDGDLEYFPKDINKLFEKIKNGDDIVFGNRFHKISHYHYKTFALANFFISKFVSILYSFKISDAAVCYKMFKKNVIEQTTINSKDFMFDFEFVSKVLKKNIWKISEVDISYKGRTFKEGKKISWLDGFRALLVILKVKLFY